MAAQPNICKNKKTKPHPNERHDMTLPLTSASRLVPRPNSALLTHPLSRPVQDEAPPGAGEGGPGSYRGAGEAD